MGHTHSYSAPNDSRKWRGVFATQSACPSDCCGGFNSQSLSEYRLLHEATRKGRRGRAGFHCESLDISFISQITHKHKGQKEPAREENRVRDRRGERTHTKYGEITTLKLNPDHVSCFQLATGYLTSGTRFPCSLKLSESHVHEGLCSTKGSNALHFN